MSMVAEEGIATRRTALAVLARVQDEGAFANLALPAELSRGGLDPRDRALVTDLVYGTLRMRRACEFLVNRFLSDPPPAAGLRPLLLGAYQLAYRDDIPAYAAVSATVGAAPRRYRGLVNAILRRVAAAPVEFRDLATELSYPDWIVELMRRDLGEDAGVAALRSMNEPAEAHTRPDGYVQDLASQWVASHVVSLLGSGSGNRVIDLCASPGGKATAIAAGGAWVAAMDRRAARVELMRSNIVRVGSETVASVLGDATRVPFASGSADGVLLDAPCSGLGVLRRRADARWRLDPAAPTRLAALQREMVDAAVPLLAPGGVLTYSVCTLTTVETRGVDAHVATEHPDLEPLPPPAAPWRPWGRGAILWPQDADTDGMAMFCYRRR